MSGASWEIPNPLLAKSTPCLLDQLVCTWMSDRGQEGKVTFTLTQHGNHSLAFMNGGRSNMLKGSNGLNDKDLLVLMSDDTQVVSPVEMINGGKGRIVLIESPEGDTGLKVTND
jgi:hypothetical protein